MREILLSRRIIVTFFLGISSGLPLLAIGSTLQAWMRETGVDLTTVGIFSLVGLPYTLKFLWAPVFDRYTPPFLGRRRGWMIITQALLAASFVLLALCEPEKQTVMTALAAVLVAFFSASQDIVVDAHRRDTLADEELGLGSSLFVNGYRVGMLMAGALALYLAEAIPWSSVYLAMAGFMLIGMVATLFSPEPEITGEAPTSFKQAAIDPLKEFFTRRGWALALIFIVIYKIGDSTASAMFMPLYLDLGFTKNEIAGVAKIFGMGATIGGGLLGGLIMLKIGINRSLWIFGLLQGISIPGFSVLAYYGHSIEMLAAVIAFENLSAGLGTAAFTAYMASLCDRRFSAFQYALLTSFMGVSRISLATFSGVAVEQVGYQLFFLGCTLLALPGMVLLLWIAPWNSEKPQST